MEKESQKQGELESKRIISRERWVTKFLTIDLFKQSSPLREAQVRIKK